MSKAHNLGAAGEEAAADLLGAHELGNGFEACFIFTEHRGITSELRRRLANEAPMVHRLEPGDGLHQHLRQLPRPPASTRKRPVVWLEQQRFDPLPWRQGLVTLNQQREWVRTTTPFFFVLAGPPDLLDLLQTSAPDFWSIRSINRILKDEPADILSARTLAPDEGGSWRLAHAGRVIRWLHLSDMHCTSTERWDRRAILTSFIRDVAGVLHEEGLAPQMVMVTGDVAFSGKREEYDQAERFLAQVASTLDLNPRDRWFVVPGNHDVDRSLIGPSDGDLLSGLDSQDKIEDVLGHSATMRLLSARLEEYYAFTERFLGAARGWREDRPFRVDVPEVEGIPVGVLQLNSAWAAGTDQDTGRLLVGEAQAHEALEQASDALLKVALLHHPLEDLKECDHRIQDLLEAPDGAAFILRGHLHRSRITVRQSPDGRVVELAGGALYTGDYPMSCTLTEVDLEEGRARVHFFRFSSEGRGFWRRDVTAYEGAPEGVWEFVLPPHLHLGERREDGDGPQAAIQLSEHRKASLVARYRTAAAAVHGTARFIGLADHRPRPNVRVPELFVPLRLRVHQGPVESQEQKPWTTARRPRIDPIPMAVQKRGVEWTTARLAAVLLHGNDEPAANERGARVVVLGDPGSGKTTLCRFLTVLLAGEASLPDVHTPEDLIPLFLPFRHYVREARDRPDLSLVSFLEQQAHVQLSLTVPGGFLEDILQQGRAVLLLDGLDEVGWPEDRADMRDRVQGFCQAYPGVSVLVTSRVAGYDDAPMTCEGPSAFYRLEAAPFDPEDLTEFVTRWYALQEPEDPVVRDERISDLLAALQAEPRVQELARNPLLATLMALIHRFEAQLPGERARLYELCVKTLLETWPAARRGRFTEIDEGLQRVYLEKLAIHMQRQRERKPGGQRTSVRDVAIGREELCEELVQILRQRHHSGEEPEQTRRRVERWLDHLEAGTGLLVQQQPGVFGFFHLSLMEYLAARGWEREVGPALPDAIAARYGEQTWLEVCLLAVGVHAEDGPFLDRLFIALDHGGSEERWLFMLRCMREEAAWSGVQLERILSGLANQLLTLRLWDWDVPGKVLEQVLRFSIRNSKEVRSWLSCRLQEAKGKDLVGAVALRIQHMKEVKEAIVLQQRWDDIVGCLMSFWPGIWIGHWAASRMSWPELLKWAWEELPHSVLGGCAVSALRQDEGGVTSFVAVALTQRTTIMNPSAILQGDLLEDKRVIVGYRFHEDWVRFSNFGFGIPFYIYYDNDFFHYHGPHFGGAFRIDTNTESTECSRQQNQMGDNTNKQQVIGPPDSTVASADQEAYGTIDRAGIKAIKENEPAEILLGPLKCEVDIALASQKHLLGERRLAYAIFRVHNRWMLQVWPLIDRQLAEGLSPNQLALYLALGWTQATTTWQWPGTDRWRAQFAGGPPEHWLPRAHWHLCWLTYDPDDGEHQRALREAVSEGQEDEERPGLAQAMAEVLGLSEANSDSGPDSDSESDSELDSRPDAQNTGTMEPGEDTEDVESAPVPEPVPGSDRK